MKVMLTRTKTERTVTDEKITGESVDEWYLELDLGDIVLGWESVGPLFEQLIDEEGVWQSSRKAEHNQVFIDKFRERFL